jgi:C-terminal processing protease CtpA/Prc
MFLSFFTENNNMKSNLTIRKRNNFSFIHLFVSLISISSIIACSQENKLYNDLVGDYEYLLEDQYIPARVFLHNDTLMCDVGVGIILVLEPINGDELRFKSENNGNIFNLQFERGGDGNISRFIFKSGDVVIPVEKLLPKTSERLYSVDEVKEDFNQLRQMIEKTHPALYVFTDPKELNRFFEQQINHIDKEMPLESIYPIFAAVTAKIGCGHSVAMMPDGYWENLEANLFPIQLKFIDNNAYVLDTYSNRDSLSTGSIIVSINGKSIGKIIDEMRKLISADAYSPTYKNFRLGKRFSSLYALLYGHPESFLIKYVEVGSSTPVDIEVNPVPVQSLPREMEDNHGLGIEIVETKNVAILTISHFAFYDNREFFYSYMDEAFSKMDQEKIGNLILDIRGNTGGDPFCAAYLLSYLEKEPIIYFSRPYGEYFKLSQPLPLHRNHFKGEFVTLIDGGGQSTTGHFTSLLKYHKFGKLIGEETGATYTCNDASRSYQLKNTRIQGHIASRTFATAVRNLPRDRGIIPDYPVVQSQEDLALGIDTVLEFALNMMK